jgi:hypothetical protein
VIGGLEDFKVGSGSTVDDQYCIGVLTIRTGGFFRRVTIKWRTSPHIESRTHHRRGNNPCAEDREQTRTEDRREDQPGGNPGAQAPRDDPGAQAPRNDPGAWAHRDDHSYGYSHIHSYGHSYSHSYVLSLIIERDLGGIFSFPYAPDRVETLCTKPPLRPHRNYTNCRKGGTLDDRDPFRDPPDREPRQARLAREGHSQPPVEGKVAEETREWARRLGIGSGELAEILRKGEGFTNEHKAKIQDSRPSMPYGSRNARARTQVTNGDQRHIEMYDHAVRHAKGCSAEQ